MELRHLKYFITIAESGSINKAAELLHISQPPLSRQLKLLESELGFRLFDRQNKRGIKLTKQGEFFLEKAKKILNTVDNTVLEAQEYNQEINKSLSIGTTIYTSPFMFNDIEMYKHSHKFNFSIWEADSLSLVQLLRERKIDIAYVNEQILDSDISITTIAEDDCVCVFSNEINHPADSASITLDELSELPLILLDSNNKSGLYEQIMETFKKYELNPKIICECHDSSMLMQLVIRGFGATILPASFLTEEIYKNLIVLPIENVPFKVTINVAWKTSDYHSPKILEFIDHVVSE